MESNELVDESAFEDIWVSAKKFEYTTYSIL